MRCEGGPQSGISARAQVGGFRRVPATGPQRGLPDCPTDSAPTRMPHAQRQVPTGHACWPRAEYLEFALRRRPETRGPRARRTSKLAGGPHVTHSTLPSTCSEPPQTPPANPSRARRTECTVLPRFPRRGARCATPRPAGARLGGSRVIRWESARGVPKSSPAKRKRDRSGCLGQSGPDPKSPRGMRWSPHALPRPAAEVAGFDSAPFRAAEHAARRTAWANTQGHPHSCDTERRRVASGRGPCAQQSPIAQASPARVAPYPSTKTALTDNARARLVNELRSL